MEPKRLDSGTESTELYLEVLKKALDSLLRQKQFIIVTERHHQTIRCGSEGSITDSNSTFTLKWKGKCSIREEGCPGSHSVGLHVKPA